MSEPVVALQGSLGCPICQGDVVLPVHFTCFPCSCAEDYCVCLYCARKYLEFENPQNDQKKCLLCPTVIYRPSSLPESKCFRTNRVYMRLDPKEYPCPLALGCAFQGKQMELERHVLEECLFRTMMCECGQFMCADDLLDHRRGCPHYRDCPTCETSIPLDSFSKHLRQEHFLELCPHTGCPEILSVDKIQDHLQRTCRHRLVECKVCHQFSLAYKIGDHLTQHLQQSRHELCQAVDRLVSAQQKMAMVAEALEKNEAV